MTTSSSCTKRKAIDSSPLSDAEMSYPSPTLTAPVNEYPLKRQRCGCVSENTLREEKEAHHGMPDTSSYTEATMETTTPVEPVRKTNNPKALWENVVRPGLLQNLASKYHCLPNEPNPFRDWKLEWLEAVVVEHWYSSELALADSNANKAEKLKKLERETLAALVANWAWLGEWALCSLARVVVGLVVDSQNSANEESF